MHTWVHGKVDQSRRARLLSGRCWKHSGQWPVWCIPARDHWESIIQSHSAGVKRLPQHSLIKISLHATLYTLSLPNHHTHKAAVLLELQLYRELFPRGMNSRGQLKQVVSFYFSLAAKKMARLMWLSDAYMPFMLGNVFSRFLPFGNLDMYL